MHIQLIFTLLQLRFLGPLYPFSFLPPAQPYPESAGLVLDVRVQVFFVVGSVVLPDVEVGSGGVGHCERQF